MLGKPGSTNPVFCMKVAGPCTLDLATIAGRNAMSSTQRRQVRNEIADPPAALAVLAAISTGWP